MFTDKRRRLAALTALLLFAGCGGGGGGGSSSTPPLISTPIAAATTSDAAATADTQAVHKYLAALSSDKEAGVIAGQNTGHGHDIALPAGALVGYASLLGPLQQQSGQTPGLVGLDYEHDHIFTPAQLSEANRVLIAHWNSGGLVTLNWSPHSPWLNDESDIANHAGTWTDTRTQGKDMSGVDLRQLLQPGTAVNVVWRRKLDRIAAALQELQRAGVVVLWRPMQEMNGSWFWWGISTSPTDATPYIELWRDMHRYFTVDKGLHNLLWVYSPNRGPANSFEAGGIHPVGATYPGGAYVDVVAGTAYGDSLDIADYETYRAFGKPVAMGEYGPTLGGATSLGGSFDTTLYSQRLLQNYPAVAYWVSWHNWQIDDVQVEHQAMVSNLNAATLLQMPSTLTSSRVRWKAYR
jgi:mannan endo-1,4-beta-mannosidase